jgi:myo-inositol-1(or 4)-monophosphatase
MRSAAFNEGDFDYLVEVVAEAAAAEIVPRFRALSAIDITQKTSAIDLVTQADVLTEARIAQAIRSRFPEALIVGEETFDADRFSISRLTDAALAFVIDPVDGTYNFAAGLPAFGTIVAVVVNGETVASLIYDCLNGDRLTAFRAAGAYLTRKDGYSAPIRVAAAVPLSQMVGAIGWAFMDEPLRSRVAANMSTIRMPISINCSAYEYWLAATGRLHFTGHGKAMPWDHLAGVLLHQEAGGYSARFDGSRYRPGDILGGILSAPDPHSWHQIRQTILGS